MSADDLSLFSPLSLRGLTLKNRIGITPMCQYSAGSDGRPGDWHLMHLGQFAAGGAGLVIAEATAVLPEGRLSPQDTGLWHDDQAAAWQRVVRFMHENDTPVGVQLVHAGRKASTEPPWRRTAFVPPDRGGWATVGPSAISFGALPAPATLDRGGIARVVEAFAAATRRAVSARFDVVEIHAAHGYLLHAFLSPLSNQRGDEYGGSFENRSRLLMEVVHAVRASWPAERPLFVRISATDWVDGGWTPDDSVRLARLLGDSGVDLVDCSSGGAVPDAVIPAEPGYQTQFSARIRTEAGVPTAAVGLITDPTQADELIRSGAADLVLLGREALRSPRWPLLAAQALGHDQEWPAPYRTAARR